MQEFFKMRPSRVVHSSDIDPTVQRQRSNKAFRRQATRNNDADAENKELEWTCVASLAAKNINM